MNDYDLDPDLPEAPLTPEDLEDYLEWQEEMNNTLDVFGFWDDEEAKVEHKPIVAELHRTEGVFLTDHTWSGAQE